MIELSNFVGCRRGDLLVIERNPQKANGLYTYKCKCVRCGNIVDEMPSNCLRNKWHVRCLNCADSRQVDEVITDGAGVEDYSLDID